MIAKNSSYVSFQEDEGGENEIQLLDYFQLDNEKEVKVFSANQSAQNFETEGK